MSTFWQRKKDRIRLRELESMVKDVAVAAHKIDTFLCVCDTEDVIAGRISKSCGVHEAAKMVFEVLRKYRPAGGEG